ncbi:hypothetical protein F5883DRAFT_580359 [Diaporthe sp. PMI_573]|jgi:hypothetical protein|nr:hypothetical protein F5883DRAFT_580359 [Diaporthaceae sp. PMI_573]
MAVLGKTLVYVVLLRCSSHLPPPIFPRTAQPQSRTFLFSYCLPPSPSLYVYTITDSTTQPRHTATSLGQAFLEGASIHYKQTYLTYMKRRIRQTDRKYR